MDSLFVERLRCHHIITLCFVVQIDTVDLRSSNGSMFEQKCQENEIEGQQQIEKKSC